MSDQQVKELFATVLEGGPVDRLDLDRAVAAGRRRRRIRTATTLASAAAVLVVVGALVVSALPDGQKTVLIGTPTSSPTLTDPTSAGVDTVIEGTADDWARAIEQYLPDGTLTPAVYANGGVLASLPGKGIFRAAYRYQRDGRQTALVVSGYATVPEPLAPAEAVAARLAELEQSCGGADVSCDPRIESSSGPVIVRRWADGSHVAASSVRAGGVVVTVDSWNADTSKNQLLEGSGQPGLIDDIDALVTLAASVPLPADLITSPSPIPTVETPTVDPSPTDVPSASGIVGVLADGSCTPPDAGREQAPPAPIPGDVRSIRICPPDGWPGLATGPVDLTSADGATFTRLLELLGQPDQPFVPPTPSPDPTAVYACPALAQPPIAVIVTTTSGAFLIHLPTYAATPTGCTFVQDDVMTALISALQAG